MNDIERLAAAIKQARLQENDQRSSGVASFQDVDVELPDTQALVNSSLIDDSAHASNDSLLQDLVTDFGLGSVTDESKSVISKEVISKEHEEVVGDRQALASTHSAPLSQDIEEVNRLHSNNMPTLHIPIEKLNAEGFITRITKRGLITEQYRRIKRPLLKNIDRENKTGRNNNVIMVTSSVSGEGKTFTSINLAMSLAMEREKTVLLVDADVLKNTASGVLDITRETLGLTDVLVGDVKDPSQVIFRTNIDNFTYMPSGTTQPHTNELLSSGRMRQLFEELSNRYHDRIIVLDCPPILQTNEATVITDYAGQVVFVVAEEDTSQSHVIEALSQIPKDNYVGVILNKSHKRILGNDYGYTYEYG